MHLESEAIGLAVKTRPNPEWWEDREAIGFLPMSGKCLIFQPDPTEVGPGMGVFPETPDGPRPLGLCTP